MKYPRPFKYRRTQPPKRSFKYKRFEFKFFYNSGHDYLEMCQMLFNRFLPWDKVTRAIMRDDDFKYRNAIKSIDIIPSDTAETTVIIIK